ncbi:MAG TPA: hypothetical protein VLG47_00795 [Candidatus Saccharimonadales bacterium]|nr:hypothetical protein [Candidatus Saccharimonadales bacterium]
MVLLGLILWAVIWIAIAFWPARVAQRKGYSFIGFFLLSILFFPFALILAYVMQDRIAQMPERSADDF